MRSIFGGLAGYQQEQATPPTTSPLGALAKKTGGEKTDVKKVTIVGGGGGAGDEGKKTGIKHGDIFPYDSGPEARVWDAGKKKYVKKHELGAAPSRVVIDTAPKK